MKSLAIVGASGLVGQEIINVLDEEKLLEKLKITLITSENNAGKIFFIKDREYRFIALGQNVANKHFDYVIFSAGEEISKKWVPIFELNGATVIDNSNAFRRDEDAPLVVPEINFEKIKNNNKIISNPNCTTIQLAVVLDRLMKKYAIKDVVVSSYQSVSGAGKNAVYDLKNNTNKYFQKGINNNFIPAIGEVLDNGFCQEEDKIMFETNKIFESKINIIATTVRVPIVNCHGESVYVRFEKDIDFEEIKKLINCEYIVLSNEILTPSECVGENKTFVCRLRQVSKNEITFFVIADNLRRGAAYNAVMILKKMMAL